MKTNQMMHRKLSELDVFQRTDNGMYNLTALLEQWNNEHPEKEKRLKDYLRLNSTQELMEEITKSHWENSPDGQNQEVTITKTVKGRNTKNGRTKDIVYGNQYLFLDAAIWMNAKYKVEAYDMLLNDPIIERNVIGDRYKDFSACCNLIGCKTPDDYKNMARCLNCAVLGVNRQSEQRNNLTKDECIKLGRLQDNFISAVENGWITTIKGAKDFFRSEYNKNFKQIPF